MKIISLILLILIISSCNEKHFDNSQELLTYINKKEHGYTQEKVIGGIKFKLLLKPTDLVAAQEIEDDMAKTGIDSIRRKYSHFIYFNLTISKNNKELLSAIPTDQAQFGALMNQISFDMSENIHLFDTKKDTFQMLDYIYPRMYGLSKSTSLLLIYEKNKISTTENLFLTIEEFGLNTGEVKFRIPSELLKKTLNLRNL